MLLLQTASTLTALHFKCPPDWWGPAHLYVGWKNSKQNLYFTWEAGHWFDNWGRGLSLWVWGAPLRGPIGGDVKVCANTHTIRINGPRYTTYTHTKAAPYMAPGTPLTTLTGGPIKLPAENICTFHRTAVHCSVLHSCIVIAHLKKLC